MAIKNQINDSEIQAILSNPQFKELNQTTQKLVIQTADKAQIEKINIGHAENIAKAGKLGVFIGTEHDNAVVNVGFVVLLFCFVIIIAIFILKAIYVERDFDSIFTGIMSMATLTLGYIFGKKSQ